MLIDSKSNLFYLQVDMFPAFEYKFIKYQPLYNLSNHFHLNMITNKLVKEAKKSDVLVEFSNKEELPEPIAQFLKICRNQSITLKRSNIPSYQISFYYVNSKKNIEYGQIQMKQIPTELEHAMTMIYMNYQNQQKITLPDRPGVRTLLLRQSLEMKYSLQYEVQSVQSKKNAVDFLCDMCAAFLNRACNKEFQFFDEKAEEIIKVKKNQANVLKDTWVNILYQIPGLGKDKCLKVAQNFPTYQSILKDYDGQQKLKDTPVGKGKLGVVLAKRIYKVFLGTKYQQSVID